MNRKTSQQRSITQEQQSPGTIAADAVYRADEVKSRMGWRNAGFRAACRRGLKVHRCGKRIYVTGADLVAFITGIGGRAEQPATGLLSPIDSETLAAH